MVAISARNTFNEKKCQLCKVIVYADYMQDYLTKFFNFTAFERFFSGISFLRTKHSYVDYWSGIIELSTRYFEPSSEYYKSKAQ